MRRYQIVGRLSAILCCAVLAFGGCGREERSDGSVQASDSNSNAVSDTEELMAYKDIRYLPEFTDTSNLWNGFASKGLGFRDDTLYVFKRNFKNYNVSGGTLIAYKPDTGEERVLLDESDTDGYMVAAASLKDGAGMALCTLKDGGYCLYKVDSEGNKTLAREYPNIPISPETLNYVMIADNQDRGYLLTQRELILFDAQGELAGNIDISGKSVNQIVCGNDGTVYLYDYWVSELIPVDFEAKSLGTDTYAVPIRRMRAIAATDRADFLICDDTTVYEYSCGDGSLKPLFDLQDSQIPNASKVKVMGEMQDGRLMLFSIDDDQETTEVALLTATPLAECPVKEVLTMGTVDPSQNLLDSVTRFNRQNTDFNISVINYCIGGREYQEARDAMKLDYSIGKGPDLCDLGDFIDPEPLYASGCFVDLSAYLGEGRQYKKEDFVSPALDIYTWQGQLMGIPKYFYLQTLVGSSDIVGTDMGWDMEDVKAVIDGHREAMIFDVAYSAHMFYVCSRNFLGEFVDRDNHKADFESEEYIAFLNFLNDLPDNFTEKEDSICWTVGDEWLRDGRALLSVRYIYDPTELQKLDSVFRGKYTCIGYPSPTKTPDCIIRSNTAYAISSASQNKDRAWEFIEWVHSSQGEERGSEQYSHRIRGGFPTRVDVFEREMQEAIEGEDWKKEQQSFWGSDIAGYQTTTPEEAELLRSLIECASPEKRSDQTILDIMEEEIAYLYDGSKTSEEVAKVTQNRVQLYLDE